MLEISLMAYRSGPGEHDSAARSTRAVARRVCGRFPAGAAAIFAALGMALAGGGAPAAGQTQIESAYSAPSLRGFEVLALRKRFEQFSDSLPEGPQLGVGDILAFEENRLFVYVLGEAPRPARASGKAEPRGGAPSFVRRLVFLKPSTFVVDDQVRVTSPHRPARWLLHARNAPDIQGRQIHIAQGDARLGCQSLLPKDVAVKSIPPTGGGQKAARHVAEVTARVEKGPWRFLHVLYAGGDGISTPRCELVEKDGLLHLKVAAGGRLFELTLPPGRADAGTIAVTKADGQTLLDRRRLPSGILPHGPKGVRLLEAWDRPYRGGRRPGWDTGRPSSELKKAVEGGTIRPCRAIVLGCGTGTNAIYLAGKGFDVAALDIAPAGLAQGEEKARKAGVRVRWLLADVLAPPRLEPFDFLFDRGCYHHVRGYNAAGYVEAVRRLSRSGTRFLLLAGSAKETRRYGPPRIKEADLRADFSKWFDFQWLRDTRFDTRGSAARGAMAWSVLLRRKEPGARSR